jgi:hypothetical protein
VDSTIYRNQILLRPLQQFREESFEYIKLPIVTEDNAPVHKKVSREILGMMTLDWPCKVLTSYQGSGFEV